MKSSKKSQFGDFQTPETLAINVVKILQSNHGVEPKVILEPSCGTGAFIRASLEAFKGAKIFGFEINDRYIEQAKLSIVAHPNYQNVTLKQANFFDTDWQAILAQQLDSNRWNHNSNNVANPILIIGNPPWVTSSELSHLNSQNLPLKSNFQNRRGIEAITGSANFDISEWMVLQYVDWIYDRAGTIAILCKYAVARKVLRQINHNLENQFSGSIYLIDAKTYFGVSVEACLFVLETQTRTSSKNFDCQVYESLESQLEPQLEPQLQPQLQLQQISYSIGSRDGFMVRDTIVYETWKHLINPDPNSQESKYIWRSGVKHDCSKVMELKRIDNSKFQNGMGKQYILEEDYLYPLLKSSDLGNGRKQTSEKFILITQTSVGEDTCTIQNNAPETWNYLLDHNDFLQSRKSVIYKNKPLYSIFGVGLYTFKAWKIAISALYKTLSFHLIGPIDGKPVIFDDTVNFLSVTTEVEARFLFGLITSKPALELLNSMIFWDDKRPITIEVLKRLSLETMARELGLLEHYLYWLNA